MARRVVLIALGIVLLVIGALAAVSGGALMALFGSNDTLSSGVQNVSTPTRALVSPAGSIRHAFGVQTVLGSVRLRITATPTEAGHQLFLGIGPASAVDRYLSGVSHDVATDVSVQPFHLTLARHGGTAAPPPPESQSFWVAKASGNHPTVTWTVTSRSYRAVVMNTDAAAPVAFTGGLNLTIPHSFAIGIGLLIGGIVLILIAIVLIVLGARTRPRSQSQTVPDPAVGVLAATFCLGRQSLHVLIQLGYPVLVPRLDGGRSDAVPQARQPHLIQDEAGVDQPALGERPHRLTECEDNADSLIVY